MASHTIAQVANPTLVGTTVDVFLFPLGRRGRVFVSNEGAVKYAATQALGTAAGDCPNPVLGGDDSVPIFAGYGRYLNEDPISPAPEQRIIVKVISSAGGVVAVELTK